MAALAVAATLVCVLPPASAARAAPSVKTDRLSALPDAERQNLLPDAERQTLSREAERSLRAAGFSLDLQTELPGDPSRSVRPDRAGEGAFPSYVDGEISAPPPSQGLIRILFWAAVIVAAAVFLMTLRNSMWSGSRTRHIASSEEEAAAPVAVAARMDKAQLEADDLARQGSFAEAMHVLLLQSVGELRRRLDVAIAASLTSREILRRVGLPEEGAAAFADIVGRVEISYFGTHEPGEEEYRACRRSFEALTRTLGAPSILSRGRA